MTSLQQNDAGREQAHIAAETLTISGLSLRQNFSWTLVGNIVYAACQWGMLVILAKIGSPVMVGQFALGLAVTAPIILFASLQLRAVQATDARHEYLFEDYLGLRLATTVMALAAIAGVVIFSGYRSETALVILAVGAAKAFEAISDVFYGRLQQHERMDRIAKSMMIKGPLSLLALGIGVYFTKSTLWGAVGLAIAWALVLIGYDIRSGMTIKGRDAVAIDVVADGGRRATLRPRWRNVTSFSLIKLSLPLGFVMLLISLNANIPRYFIEHYLGERELGIFAAVAYLMVAGTMVVNALGQSASPRLAKYYAAAEAKAFRHLLGKLIVISVLLGVAGVALVVAAGETILTMIYKPEYAQHVDVFLLLMVAAGLGFFASFLGYAMTAARYFRVQAPLFAVVTGVTALACLWLVPLYGLRGAAMALVIATAVQLLGSLAITVFAIYKLNICAKGAMAHGSL
ncbi:MAG: oligosaccharide flippase family protein [Candidatus Aquicultor sp.]|nr:oligosaccharide flippase family protein [Candidatus Aquicultor sp.]